MFPQFLTASIAVLWTVGAVSADIAGATDTEPWGYMLEDFEEIDLGSTGPDPIAIFDGAGTITSSIGYIFSDSNPMPLFDNGSTEPIGTRGYGLLGVGTMTIEIEQLARTFAGHFTAAWIDGNPLFNGVVDFTFRSGGEVVHTEALDLSHQPGEMRYEVFFIAPTAWDSVEIDGAYVAMDNIVINAPVPGPASIMVLSVAGLLMGRRRRRHPMPSPTPS